MITQQITLHHVIASSSAHTYCSTVQTQLSYSAINSLNIFEGRRTINIAFDCKASTIISHFSYLLPLAFKERRGVIIIVSDKYIMGVWCVDNKAWNDQHQYSPDHIMNQSVNDVPDPGDSLTDAGIIRQCLYILNMTIPWSAPAHHTTN